MKEGQTINLFNQVRHFTDPEWVNDMMGVIEGKDYSKPFMPISGTMWLSRHSQRRIKLRSCSTTEVVAEFNELTGASTRMSVGALLANYTQL